MAADFLLCMVLPSENFKRAIFGSRKIESRNQLANHDMAPVGLNIWWICWWQFIGRRINDKLSLPLLTSSFTSIYGNLSTRLHNNTSTRAYWFSVRDEIRLLYTFIYRYIDSLTFEHVPSFSSGYAEIYMYIYVVLHSVCMYIFWVVW